MPVLDRYFFRDLIVVYTITLAALIAFYVAVDLISHVTRHNMPFSLIWSFYKYKIPTILSQMMTVSTFLAILISYSGFSRSLELVAMSAGGISTFRIFAPAVSLAFGISTLHLLVADQWATRSFLMYRHKRSEILAGPGVKLEFNPYGYKQQNIWFRSENRIYNFLSTSEDAQTIYGISMLEVGPDFRLSRRIEAKEARYEDHKWALYNGREILFTGPTNPAVFIPFQRREIAFTASPTDIKEVIPQTSGMKISELKKFIARNVRAGVDDSRLSVEFHSRIALSFSCVIFTLLALPFCTKSTRYHNLAVNISVCFIFVIVYWSLFQFLLSLGNSKTVIPFLAAWGSNFIYGGVAAALLYKKGAIS